MSVAADAPISHEHAGTTYRFCCNGCRTKFAADPEGWLSGSARKPAAEAPADAVYTCPMHPEIEQIGPGDCPLCGMALEPKEISADEGPSADYVEMRRRSLVAAAWLVLGLHADAQPLASPPAGAGPPPASKDILSEREWRQLESAAARGLDAGPAMSAGHP